MTDRRPVCANLEDHDDNNARRMKVVRNGVFVTYGDSRHQQGDKWECSECGNTIVQGTGEPYEPSQKALDESGEFEVTE